jgi:hypothetical protein
MPKKPFLELDVYRSYALPEAPYLMRSAWTTREDAENTLRVERLNKVDGDGSVLDTNVAAKAWYRQLERALARG